MQVKIFNHGISKLLLTRPGSLMRCFWLWFFGSSGLAFILDFVDTALSICHFLGEYGDLLIGSAWTCQSFYHLVFKHDGVPLHRSLKRSSSVERNSLANLLSFFSWRVLCISTWAYFEFRVREQCNSKWSTTNKVYIRLTVAVLRWNGGPQIIISLWNPLMARLAGIKHILKTSGIHPNICATVTRNARLGVYNIGRHLNLIVI